MPTLLYVLMLKVYAQLLVFQGILSREKWFLFFNVEDDDSHNKRFEFMYIHFKNTKIVVDCLFVIWKDNIQYQKQLLLKMGDENWWKTYNIFYSTMYSVICVYICLGKAKGQRKHKHKKEFHNR